MSLKKHKFPWAPLVKRTPGLFPTIASIIYYGPNANRATKVAVGILENDEVQEMKKWYCETVDIRRNQIVNKEIVSFLKAHEIEAIACVDKVLGCPHEQGIDYDSEYCPVCTYWQGRDRFAGLNLES